MESMYAHLNVQDEDFCVHEEMEVEDVKVDEILGGRGRYGEDTKTGHEAWHTESQDLGSYRAGEEVKELIRG